MVRKSYVLMVLALFLSIFGGKLARLIVKYTTVEKAESRDYNLNTKEELYIGLLFELSATRKRVGEAH